MKDCFEEVLNKIIEQIYNDVNNYNHTAIEELLKEVPYKSLVAYVSEEV